MRTYILYTGDEEEYRGTLPDCLDYLEEGKTYANDTDYHLVIMLPHPIKWVELSTSEIVALKSVVVCQKRIEINNDLINKYLSKES